MNLPNEKEGAGPEPLVRALLEELMRGSRSIEGIEDRLYSRKANGTGSIGGHFRHNLDFTDSFLNGIENGRIDYSRRERDVRTEEDRGYAIGRFELTIRRLRGLTPDLIGQKVWVRSETCTEIWHESSIARELEFLHSHTVHHHALVVEKLAFFGVRASENFGVAPSTLKFWEQQKAAQAA